MRVEDSVESEQVAAQAFSVKGAKEQRKKKSEIIALTNKTALDKEVEFYKVQDISNKEGNEQPSHGQTNKDDQ